MSQMDEQKVARMWTQLRADPVVTWSVHESIGLNGHKYVIVSVHLAPTHYLMERKQAVIWTNGNEF